MTTSDMVVRPTAEVCGAGTTKRATRAEMEFRRSALLDLAEKARPASVRHIYYRAVVAGLVEKKETGYRKVQRELLDLRRRGLLPFDWIVDEGRRAHWPTVHVSPSTCLQEAVETYRRDPWQAEWMPRLEVWCESESIAGTLLPLRDEYAVPIFPIKGQASETFVWNAARSYSGDREVVVLYAGDYDPAGLQIGAQLEGKLRDYAPASVSLTFVRVGITDDQASRLQALSTPAKQSHWIDYDGDRHEFVGGAIEAEALDPAGLRDLFAQEIAEVAFDAVGYDVFARNRELEAAERSQLVEFVGRWGS